MSRKPPLPTRRKRGFEAAASLVAPQIRRAGESRGFAVARLLTHWSEIAGADIAALCRPVKVSYAKGGLGGTLVVLTTGAAAPLLQMQLGTLRDRVNACYGYNAIARITLTQTAPTGFAEGQAQFTPAPPAKPAPPPPATRAKAARTAGAIRDDDLRRALETLATNILSKATPARGDTS